VADFDASHDFQNALAIGRRIAGDHVANVGDLRLGEITAKVHTS